MRYWWVNHKQTFAQEVGNGYLWSPKSSKGGVFNQTYLNMTLAEAGDLVFSYANQKITAVGVVIAPATDLRKPLEFGSKGSNWADEGWFLPVEFSDVPISIKPKDHIESIRPLLPNKYYPIDQRGNGLQNSYLTEISGELAILLLKLLGSPELVQPVVDLRDLTHNLEDEEIFADTQLRDTEKRTLVLARRGQGDFRKRVHLIEKFCRVTEVSADSLLVASHIKPWAESDNTERLSGNNGLFLSPHIDKLFDKGFISFGQNGQMLVSPLLDADVLEKWSIDPARKYGKFNTEQAYFLEFHNEKVFRSSAA